ncbi:hypothetical protein [Campylobacter concisus]|uniref:Uncharacterized protein n=1 Tax=Campylobacter concisus TaxID=199 RepID=A0A1Y5MFQ3_9BACT|nr:hypothetical protein [Campylobacter concisus]MBE9835381.1 hypothetical protein [Campylobacter concisus]MBE9856451.1 hypothetical protein [Campylobacter concisus]OUT07430.1 hypothetical protein B9N65_07380 [Campylobacter concisus]QPH92952.1 hypothetical protein CVT07_00320 [Campylobacter concisus]
MTNTVMLQGQNGFIITSEIISAMKQLFGEKIKVVEIDDELIDNVLDIKDAKEAEEIYARFVASNSKGTTLDELKKENCL